MEVYLKFPWQSVPLIILKTKFSLIENGELFLVLFKAVETSPPFKLLWSCDIDEYIPSQDPYSGLKACLR